MMRMSMKRRLCIATRCITAACVLTMAVAFASPVSAQGGPDIRSVPPMIMMMIDSSGSMEKVGDCACITPTCSECMPNCGVASPVRNRWSTVIEALTGSIQGYACALQDRSQASFSGEPDHRYFLPHVQLQGVACSATLPCSAGFSCSADSTPAVGDTGFCQQDDGILDVYRDRAKFGLMTFDAVSTFAGAGELMTAIDFNARGSQNEANQGGYSYGEPRPFSFPDCGTPYMIDNGARNESAAAGRLVSVGQEGVDPIAVVNRDVQGTLVSSGMRPFGATPIAGMLADVEHYFTSHPDTRRIASIGLTGDPFNGCRNRYAILLTDGQPTSDMRGDPFNCDALGQPVGAGGCPYDTPIETASRMIAPENRTVDGLFVVGFNVTGDNCPVGDAACRATAAETVATLNDLAAAGGTTEAIFADDRATLIEALTLIMDAAAPGTTTRTVPAFGAAGGAAGTAGQLQFNTGFNLSTEAGTPWSGVLERRRIECDGLAPTPRPIEDRDRFHVQLNSQTGTIDSNGYARRLLTIVPATDADYGQRLVGTAETTVTGDGLPLPPNTSGIAQGGLELTEFRLDNLNVSAQLLGVGTTARREEVIEWMHGFPGTERDGNRLGSIYHSSPVVVSAPSTDILDEGFNLFRQRPEVSGRPSMVYVGSNDGILHGFVGQDHTFPIGHPRAGQSIAAGEELWGFIPPMLLRTLDGALDSQQWMVDGTPLVRDIFFARDPAADDGGDEYHTVLVNGMRAGGNGFIALDVTDPVNPDFLWQYTDILFGNTYGQAAMGQVLIDMAGRVHERGIVILPAGHGSIRSNGSCDATAEAPTSGPAAIPAGGRSGRRCWNTQGRGLVVLDAASGRVIRRWDSASLPSPVNGGVSVFLGETGTAATRAFVTDADGVIWRLDLSNSDPLQWELQAFHDMFQGMAFDAGQPAYPSPILTTDTEGDVVVIQGTGDIDRLENYTVRNRVVSVREEIVRNSTTGVVESVSGVLNWNVTLDAGEQVTGPVDLFQGNVYFGTFSSTSNSLDACQVGFSRIWGLEYLNDNGSGGPMPALESVPGSGVFDRTNIDDSDDSALLNQIVMGVAVTQRPTCIDGRNVTETDPYIGSRQTFRVDAASPPAFELVAQLSGGGTGTSGGSVGEFVRSLPAPIAYTQTVGYAGTVQ